MATNRPPQEKYTTQQVLNNTYDEDHDVIMTEQVGFDGSTIQRGIGESMAMKLTEDGTDTYIAIAAPGTAEATAGWQVKKLDESSGLVISWADGNASFDNVATDLTALSYS